MQLTPERAESFPPDLCVETSGYKCDLPCTPQMKAGGTVTKDASSSRMLSRILALSSQTRVV